VTIEGEDPSDAKAIEDSKPQDRAGPDEERLEFEEDFALAVGQGLGKIRREVVRRLRADA